MRQLLRPVRTGAIIAALSFGLVAGLSGAAMAQSVTTLSVASWAGPNHAINSAGWKRIAEMVEQKSNGTLKLDVNFPPVNPRVMFDRVAEGISDMAWGFNGYTPGRFDTYLIAELPGLGVGSEGASIAYWRTHEKFLAPANEYRAVRLLGLFAQPPSVIHTRRQVSSLADLKGLKIRVGGGVQAEVAKTLGMVGVQAPVGEAYQMIRDGVVDGTFFPTETAISFKLNEVAPHQLGFREGLFGAAYFIVMNRAKYDSLSAAHKKVIDEVSGEVMAATFGRAWDESEKAAIARLAPSASGGYRTAPAEMSAEVMKMLRPIDDMFLSAAAKRGIDGPAALAYMRAQARELAGSGR